MRMNSLRDLFVEQMQDLYNAEQQLIKALPKVAEAASTEELRSAVEEHLGQTEEHARRLEQAFELLGEKAEGRKCKGMEGLIKEASEAIKENMASNVKDAALIAGAQRVEHYEIAGYGCVKTYASLLEENEVVGLLDQTLQEEKETDEKLSQLADNINVEAAEEGEQEGESKSAKPASKRRSGKTKVAA